MPNLVGFHCLILVTLKFQKSIQKTFKREVWLYDRGNYNHYRQKLNDANWDALFTSNNINEISDNITQHILTAAKDTIPNKKVTIRPNEPEWINSKIKTLIRQRKRLFRKAKRTNTEHAWNKFKLKQNEVTKHLREGKIKYFQKLSQDLRNNSSNSKSWYRTASKFLLYDSNQNGVPILESNGLVIESDDQKAEVLNEFFIQHSTVDDTNAHLPNLVAPNYDTLNEIVVTQQDVIKAINEFDANKASGPDGISPKLIKEGKHELAYPYTKLFNLSIRLQKFPDSYKLSNVIPIHKNDSKTNPKNYRPISLISIQGKLMEKIINKKLNEYLVFNNVISPFQSGFRRGDSTVNQLLLMNHEFSKALDENKEI